MRNLFVAVGIAGFLAACQQAPEPVPIAVAAPPPPPVVMQPAYERPYIPPTTSVYVAPRRYAHYHRRHTHWRYHHHVTTITVHHRVVHHRRVQPKATSQ
jgi:hypothetical protein